MRSLTTAAACLAVATSAAGQVQINEIYASHAGTDDQEFVELKGPAGFDLTNHVVCVVEGDGGGTLGTLDRVWDLTGLTIPASGYFVLGDAAVVPNDFSIGTSNAIENGNDTFYLIDAIDPAAIAALDGSNIVISGTDTLLGNGSLGTIVDVIGMVDGGFFSAGSSDAIFDGSEYVGPDGSFLPAGIFRNGDDGWCGTSFLDFDDVVNADLPRTPGAANTVASCPDQVRLTEVLHSGADGGFYEATNVGGLNVDLAGYSLSNGTDTADLTSLGTLGFGQSVVVTNEDAGTFAANWGLGSSVLGSAGMTMSGNETVSLVDGDSNTLDSVSFGAAAAMPAIGVSAWRHGDDDAGDDAGWEASFPGDDQGSVSSAGGDWGNPGAHGQLDGDDRGDWSNLGNGLAGTGSPSLVGGGSLTDDAAIATRASNGLPGAVVVQFFGLTTINAPFKGGVMVPEADFALFGTYDAAGTFALSSTWPADAPSAFSVFIQTWSQDGGGPVGAAGTNAISLTTP